MNATDWIIRPYQPGDERQIVALFERVFGHPISEEHWRWKVKQLPSPLANVWLAVADGKAIFHSAGIPVRFQLLGQNAIAMVSVDTMTAPEYRRRGLLTQVGRIMYDHYREAGIPFVIGLINEQWGSRAPALGWTELFCLEWQIRPLRPAALLARRFKLPALSQLTLPGALWNRFWDRHLRPDGSIQIRHVERAGPEFDALWQTCAHDAALSIVRDSAWVNWRYIAAPSYTYRVMLAERAGQAVGYVAYRLQESQGRKFGFIAELLTQRADVKARHTLVRYTLDQINGEGAEAALTQSVPGTWLYRTFRRAGFLWSWGTFSVQMVPLDPQLPMSLLHNPQNWLMSGGDFDSI